MGEWVGEGKSETFKKKLNLEMCYFHALASLLKFEGDWLA